MEIFVPDVELRGGDHDLPFSPSFEASKRSPVEHDLHRVRGVQRPVRANCKGTRYQEEGE